MTTIAFYDAKPYDREYFERAVGGMAVLLHHHDFRLTAENFNLPGNLNLRSYDGRWWRRSG